MTFEEKWQFFSHHAKFNSNLKWVQLATSFIIDNAPAGTVEFSFKSSHQHIYFNRAHIRFRNHQQSYYQQWYRIVTEIGQCWKIVWKDQDTRSFFNNFDWSICDSFYAGFDLRPQKKDSRLKIWCACRCDKKTIQEIIKNYSFKKDHLYPFWKKYSSERILLGWIYKGNGDVSWRVYPEIPTKHLVLASKNHVVKELGPLSAMLASSWPSPQSLIHWGNINNKELFIDKLKPLLLYPHKAINLAKDLQQQGFNLSLVCTSLPATKKDKITESNFYFK